MKAGQITNRRMNDNEFIAELRAQGLSTPDARAALGVFNFFYGDTAHWIRLKVPGTECFLSFTIEEIDAVKAKRYLDTSKGNRKFRLRNLEKISDALRLMQWMCNGSPIIFDSDGAVRDGHHRLQAVIDTGISIVSVVVRGVDPDSYKTMDIGEKRTAGDVLFLDEDLDIGGGYNAIAAACTWMWKFEEGLMCAVRTKTLTASRCPEYVRKYPGLVESFRKASRFHTILGQSPATFLHYQFSVNSSPAVADEFFEILKSGAMLEANHPIFRLRERLNGDKARRVDGPTYEKIALGIKAFNYWRSGKKVNVLVWKESQEPFPVLTNEHALAKSNNEE